MSKLGPGYTGSGITTSSPNTWTGDQSFSRVGFQGTVAQAKPAAYTLAGPAASRNLTAPTAVQTTSTAATNVTPFGYSTAAQADGVRLAVNHLVTDLAAVQAVVAQIVTDLESYGLVG